MGKGTCTPPRQACRDLATRSKQQRNLPQGQGKQHCYRYSLRSNSSRRSHEASAQNTPAVRLLHCTAAARRDASSKGTRSANRTRREPQTHVAIKAAPTSVKEGAERLHRCLCLRQAPWKPRCKSMLMRSCSCCQVCPGGRFSRESTSLANDWRSVAVSPPKPPVLSRIIGSNPKFCRAHLCCMSAWCRLRSVYRSAAANGMEAEGRITEF